MLTHEFVKDGVCARVAQCHSTQEFPTLTQWMDHLRETTRKHQNSWTSRRLVRCAKRYSSTILHSTGSCSRPMVRGERYDAIIFIPSL
jgi:hypothetical protein